MSFTNIIAVINQKGGVGKSTTAHAIGAGLSLKGYKVLFIDLDAQGNLSYTAGAQAGGLSALDVLQLQATAKEAIQSTEQGDIIASSPGLSGADTTITSTGKEYRLREAIAPLNGLYDYIVIDTPPALGILAINALTACTDAIIPAQADIYSLQGISQLHSTIETVKRYCNPSLNIKGIVLTRFNSRAIISREAADMIEQTAEQLHTKLYQSKIRECTAIKEAQATRKSIYDYAPQSNAAADYSALVDEIIKEE
ncbi:MAG: ParA family protein [Clostridia bacterium]|nr:ParA family protein [Clostridia bacterium]